MKLSCPHCQQKLEATPEMYGQITDCPACANALQIPATLTDNEINTPMQSQKHSGFFSKIKSLLLCLIKPYSLLMEMQKKWLEERNKQREDRQKLLKQQEQKKQQDDAEAKQLLRQQEDQKKQQEQKKQQDEEEAKQLLRHQEASEIFLIRQEIITLRRSYAGCFYTDYSSKRNFDHAKWLEQVSRFKNWKMNGQSTTGFSDLVINEIKVFEEQNRLNIQYNDAMTGIEYENYCKSLLEQKYWMCKLTPKSGDQGADIIGERQNIVMVFQCKRYKASVGNKAIQEAYAAKGHYKADDCAVVSNADYTKSARELAQSLNVHLLHHSDLDNI